MASLASRLRKALTTGYGGRSNLKLYMQYARRDPAWALMFSCARFELARKVATRAPRNPYPLPSDDESIFPDLDVATAVDSLEQDGLVPGLNIGADRVAAIMDHLNTAPCYVDPDPDHVFQLREKAEAERAAGRTFIRAAYFLEDVGSCETIRRIANDPKLLAVASRYLGTPNPVAEGQIHWNFPNDNERDLRDIGQAMHFDVEDYCGIRLFIYLTDVDATAGPHVVIVGSHREKRMLHRLPFGFRQVEGELVDLYGKERVVTITGPAGTTFIEDPFCFHRGSPPSSTARLLLAIVYKRCHYRLEKEIPLPPLPS